MKNHVATIVSGIAVVTMCAIIFWLSDQPADDSTAMSMGLLNHIIGFVVPGYDQMSISEQLYWQKTLEHPLRKLAHFSEYAVLGALIMNFFMRVRKEQPNVLMVACSCALAAAYAGTDELHQIFVPGRSCMITDVLIDTCGALVGVLLLLLCLKLARRFRS